MSLGLLGEGLDEIVVGDAGEEVGDAHTIFVLCPKGEEMGEREEAGEGDIIIGTNTDLSPFALQSHILDGTWTLSIESIAALLD